MRAMVLERIATIEPGSTPLRATDLPDPEPGPGEVRVRVSACGVCRTELDEIEGRLLPTRLPVVPGHQVVGRIDVRGEGAVRHAVGTRVGVGWIHRSSGGPGENLSPEFRATGRDVDGGYADFLTVPEAYAYPIPPVFEDAQAAPLLCAGAVGFRALRRSGLEDGEALGLSGFGGSAHLVLQLARRRFPNGRVHVFARRAEERAFARELGADWAGEFGDAPPEPLAACIDTTPAWVPVLESLRALAPGGRLVVNAIRKEDGDRDRLAGLDYREQLWMEKELTTVANVTAADVAEFLELAASIPLAPEVTPYPLLEANRALRELKFSAVRGAKVLIVGD